MDDGAERMVILRPGDRWRAEVNAAVSIAYVSAGLLVALLLWLYPAVLARIAMRGSTDQVFDSAISALDLQRIALSLLGMYFVMSGVLDLISVGLQSLWLSGMLGQDGLYFRRARMVDCAYFGVQIVIGLIVCLGAGGLANVLDRLRHAGSSRRATDATTEHPPAA
jgi:hypothetical protein